MLHHFQWLAIIDRTALYLKILKKPVQELSDEVEFGNATWNISQYNYH